MRLGSTDSAVDAVPIVPSDGTDLPVVARAIRCRGDSNSGTLRVTTLSGSVRNTYIGSGELLTLQVTRVHATGTTATGLEAMV